MLDGLLAGLDSSSQSQVRKDRSVPKGQKANQGRQARRYTGQLPYAVVLASTPREVVLIFVPQATWFRPRLRRAKSQPTRDRAAATFATVPLWAFAASADHVDNK